MQVFFIGIGGIGVSALAKHFLISGKKVAGSDLAENEIIDELRKRGARITKGHFEENISEKIDLVVYSPAVPSDNPELEKARELGLEIKSYPEALGDLTRNFFTIAVSGTHGKSTTTSMAALMMIEAGLDPTVIVGTKLEEFENGNYRHGKSDYLLMEADEWKGSFLNYSPDIIILTNLEKEHLDYYRDMDQIMDTFQKYLHGMKKGGRVIINSEDENLKKLKFKSEVRRFSKLKPEAEKVKKILKLPGDYNLENAMAVFELGRELKIKDDIIFKALSSYKGCWRRFQEKNISIEGNRKLLILDYAHHPTELKSVLSGVVEKYGDRPIRAVFQPHQYQRALHLKQEFIDVFNNSPVDLMMVTDIYSVPGREKEEIKKKINSKKLVEEADNENLVYIPGSLKDIGAYLKKNLRDDEVVVIIGAGNIHKLEDVLRNKCL